MNRITKSFLSVLLVLVACDQDPGFNFSLIPGEYKGSLYYFSADGPNGSVVHVPSMSKVDEFRTTIIADGGLDYTFSFDKNFKYTIPDVTVEAFSIVDGATVALKTATGQAYSSSADLNNAPGQVPNYITNDAHVSTMRLDLTLKSNDPDSAYYLNVVVRRTY